MTPEQLEYTADVVTRARNVIEAQRAEIEQLKQRNAAMQTATEFLQRYALAVNAHNIKCDTECNDGVSCGYEGYLRRTGRRCASCPAAFKVDPMPHKGQA